MLTVSPLAGLFDLPSVKPDTGGGAAAFAPLMAGLLGPEITTDCTSLPPGGENVPVATLSPDTVETPAILIAAGSPVLPALGTPARSPAAPPARFAPIVVPAAPPAAPLLASDPAPAATPTADELRPEGGTRIALPASVATPLPVMPPLPARARARAPIAALAEVPAKSVATGRSMATTAPVPADSEEAPPPPAATVEPSPSLVPTDPPVTPDPVQILLAPVVVPPPAREADAPAKPAATARTLPEVAPPATARDATDPAIPSPVASPTDTSAAAPAIAATPTMIKPVAAVGRRNPEQEPRATAATVVPGTPAIRADIAAIVMPQRPARPMAVDARPVPAPATIVPAAIRPIVQPAPPVVADNARAVTPPVLVLPTEAAIVVEAPARAPATVGVTPTDVPASSRDRRTADALAVTPPAIERANVSPTVSMAAAAPVILPALQAFGAAIRRAMADERKPALPSDDIGLGTATLAGPTAAAPAQTVVQSDTTLDTADRRWPHAMAEQIEKLRDAADAQSTRIRLLPDALGPVDVAVRRDGEQVHVHFTAAQAETRQLLADAQPRLADAAEARGVKLGRTDVSGGDLTGDRQQQRPATQNPQPSRPAPARTRAATADTDNARLA